MTSPKALFRSPFAIWLALPVGAALSLAFAPFDVWPLAILCPAYLFLAWHDASAGRAAKLGFLFTAGTYLSGTYWLFHSIYEIGHAPIWLTLVAMLGLVAIMGAYTALLGYVITRWLPTNIPTSRFLLIYPAAWTLLEWFRGWFLSGFPWLANGYTQIDTPLAAYAPIGGVYAASLAVYISAGAIACLLLGATRTRITALASLATLWIVGALLWNHEWTSPVGKPVSVALVQGAVPQEMKWNQAQFLNTLQLYRELTEANFGKQIIVLPETALAAPVHQLGDYLGPLWVAAKARGSSLVIGQLRYDAKDDVYYNAIVALANDAQWYAKRRLVPLAEFFPVPAFVSDWLKGLDLPYSGFQAGDATQPALDAGGQKLAATICYEDSYASDQLEVLKDATLLVNVTNDAWFGDSTAAPQHLQISRMRALEAGRASMRAANDGISAIIKADGKVASTLPRFQPGVLTGEVQPREGLTPYAHVGNWLVVSLCFVIVLVTLSVRVARLRQLRESELPV